jgi:protein-S-isoprenylcysteine O-methyltransferase Ste14
MSVHQGSRHRKRAWIVAAWAVLAYGGFVASIAALVPFLLDLGMPVTVDRRAAALGGIAAALVDLALVGLFGLQHSVMARPGFKRVWTRFVPPAAERATYVMASSALLFVLLVAWQPLPAIVWRIDVPLLRALVHTGFAAAVVMLVVASFHIDHLQLLGLRQALRPLALVAAPVAGLRERGLYRLVRHPIQAGWIALFWCTPTMSAGHLLLAVAMTAYAIIGTHHEERDLSRELGPAYASYRARVGGFWPRSVRATMECNAAPSRARCSNRNR